MSDDYFIFPELDLYILPWALLITQFFKRLKWSPPLAMHDILWKERNILPKIYPAYKMHRDKDRAKTEGTANQQLASHMSEATQTL